MSHRLRGFGVPENSLEGLRLASRTGIRFIEIDTRHTHDDVIIVYHYPFFESQNGIRPIKEMDFEEIKTQYSLDEDRSIVTLREFLETLKSINCDAMLCIDIKDFGLEKQYTDLITRLNLVKQTCIISWIPETLVRIHYLLPEIKLSFSHVSLMNYPWLFKILNFFLNQLDILGKALTIFPNKSSFFFKKHSVIKTYFDVYNGTPNRKISSLFSVGFRHCHFLSTFPQGELKEILKRVSGSITVPHVLTNRGFVKYAHSQGINVWVFSIHKKNKLNRYVKRVQPDNVFTDNPYLIPGMKDIITPGRRGTS